MGGVSRSDDLPSWLRQNEREGRCGVENRTGWPARWLYSSWSRAIGRQGNEWLGWRCPGHGLLLEVGGISGVGGVVAGAWVSADGAASASGCGAVACPSARLPPKCR